MLRIANNKLRRSNVEKLLASTVLIADENGQALEVPNINSKYGIQLYIELSKRQDFTGKVEGVHHVEFEELLGCSKATFYSVLYELEALEYIKAISNPKNGYWTITILNNEFRTKEDDKKGYIRTNVDFLYTDEFKNLSVTAKKMCLYLHLNKNPRQDLEIYPEKLAAAIGIKIVNVVKEALEDIKGFFPYEFKEGKQGMKLLFKGSTMCKNEHSEVGNYLLHKLKYFCKLYKVKASLQDIEDVAIMSKQYGDIGFNHFMKVVCKAIFEISIDKSIQPRLINDLCQKEKVRQQELGIYDPLAFS